MGQPRDRQLGSQPEWPPDLSPLSFMLGSWLWPFTSMDRGQMRAIWTAHRWVCDGQLTREPFQPQPTGSPNSGRMEIHFTRLLPIPEAQAIKHAASLMPELPRSLGAGDRVRPEGATTRPGSGAADAAGSCCPGREPLGPVLQRLSPPPDAIRGSSPKDSTLLRTLKYASLPSQSCQLKPDHRTRHVTNPVT